MLELTAFGPLVLGRLPVGCWSWPSGGLLAGTYAHTRARRPDKTPIKLPLAIRLLASRLLASGTFLT